ncbi:MAG: MFS transporter [Promethearchaeota archaeon]
MSRIIREDALGYWQRIRQFTPNAQKLIIANVLRAFGWGIAQTLFNLYLLSLGYNNAFVGSLMSINAFTMALCSLIMGPVVSRFGTKRSLILAAFIMFGASTSQVVFPIATILHIAAVFSGLGSAMLNVAFGPFMTKFSTPYERTHLFGTSQSATILSSFFANTLAGFLPGLFAITFGFPIDSAISFQWALLVQIIPFSLGFIPLLLIREKDQFPILDPRNDTVEIEPVEKKEIKKLLLKFGIVNAFIGLGAGFVIPYLNIFFWEFYNLPTFMVGLVQGLGSLSVAAGVFLSPVLSTRIGKVKTVLVTQSLSLPFLFFIAVIINPYVAITSYIFRVVLMNASGPVDNALRMELTPESYRPHMSAVSSFAWNFPWAFSTLVTGPLFDQGLYLIPFWFTLTSYSASTVIYAAFFWNIEKRQKKRESPVSVIVEKKG